MPPALFIIMPAYNAARSLRGVFERIPADIRERLAGLVVVDDGSGDDTREVLRGLQAEWPTLTVLEHGVNRGYGAAEKTLLDEALRQGAELLILLHADGQYAPEKMAEILDRFIENEADLVQGSRMLSGGALQGGMPRYKYLANKVLTGLENRAFGLKMAEYHSGYMAYHRRFLEQVPYDRLSDSFDFDLEMIVMARILEARIEEVAIPTRYADEVSHLNPIRYGLDVLRVIRRYRRGYYRNLLDPAQDA